MPSPTKRSQRPRRDSARKELVSERPDTSSPSRPAKRRKKTEDDSPKEIVEEEGSSLVADELSSASDYDSIVSRVAQHLLTPSNQVVQASKDHSNAIHESNKAGVQAYAKIAAPDWTFYITKLAINIGRSSDPPQQHADDYDPENDEDFIHIDLGPSKMISRQHALIYFNSKEEKWFLVVKGRNGAKIDGSPLKPGESAPLASGEVVEISGIEMMFVLPSEINDLHIHPTYLQRAGLSKDDLPTQVQPRSIVRPDSIGGSSSPPVILQGKLSRGQSSQQAIAPAPPDYKRPGTPPSARKATQTLQSKSPAYRGSGTLLMSSSDVDLSLDENQNIKPQYSYAQMITQAIMNTPDGKLNLNGIYTFIMSKYAYYRHQQAAGWQNSIRHNLSLNKAFEKVARSTDEPGKGMKWQIVAEVRDDMVRNAYRGGRGGHRGSSNPSSPNQLNYITQGPRDMAARDPGSARKRKVSPSGSPQPRSSLRTSHMTPDRNSRRFASEDTTIAGDGSPLPRLRKTTETGAPSLVQGTPRSPTLTSSYLQDEGASFVTPAPHRVHPKLAPPSTAQRPSQHMPTSSPAPFWKYAEIGSTPLKPAQFDLSPSKALGTVPQSSSPPPAARKSPAASPTRGDHTEGEEPTKAEELEEDGGFDLTKGFQSIGSYHAPASRGLPVATATNGES
ncbi:Forkhead box protein J2 [Pleurostoma richardsiae]|uniref:Forkhead box protein J2 n=1 Tax=Pleurostoma richardsiae TaxID=41990 RepID=A0AA38S1Y9_9PEZI|nr:Forkhead box protein J2 [Pleurostoma richardsiae]